MAKVPIFWDHNGPQGKPGPGDLLVVYLDFAADEGKIDKAANQYLQSLAEGYARREPGFTYAKVSSTSLDLFELHAMGKTEKELDALAEDLLSKAHQAGRVQLQDHADAIFAALTGDRYPVGISSSPDPIVKAYNRIFKRYRDVHGSPLNYDAKKATSIGRMVGKAKADLIGKFLANGKYQKAGSRAVGDTILDWDGMALADEAIFVYPDPEAFEFARSNKISVWPDPEDIAFKMNRPPDKPPEDAAHQPT